MMSEELGPVNDELGPVDDPKVTSGRHKCIVMGLVVVAALAIAAIVLPLVLDTCDCGTNNIPNVRVTSPPVSSGQPVLPPASGPTAQVPTPAFPTFPTAPTVPTQPSPTAPAPSPSVPNPNVPTSAPTSEVLKQFIEVFLVPLSGNQVFRNPNSPQYKAAEFLADEDSVGRTLPGTGHLADRYALTTFYFAMDGDDSWFRCFKGDTECGDSGSAWLDAEVHHCDWNSITCNEERRVTSVFFETTEGNGLVGTIPREFALLEELEVFVAVNNLISGQFPVEFGNLKKMKRVILNTNLMNGGIPEGFLAESPLELFFVANNGFSGEIPSSFGSIPTLTQLVLANNNFSGVIPPQLGNLENLGTLDLSGNLRIRGPIPTQIYSLAFLENLYLNGCRNIQGTLSGDISGMTSLIALRLGGTSLGGVLPAALFTLPNLTELDLTQAMFSGRLSEDFILLSSTLRILRLANNNFSGPIPAAFDTMTLLNALDLVGNDLLTGSISAALCSRRGEGRNQLQQVTAPCDLACTCCTNQCVGGGF